jgi:Tol biopolymer transport system component
MSPRQVHHLLRCFLAIGAIAASGCVDAPTTAPRFVAGEDASAAKQSTSSSKILVMSDGPNTNGSFQVFTLSDDGSQVLQVTNFDNRGLHPSWAPDGKRILFIGSLNANDAILDIASINSDGTGVTFLHLESLCPNYPVALGKDIMFIDGCTGILYRVHTDGTGLTPLLTGVCLSQPSADAQARTVALCRGGDIMRLDVESGVITNITNSPNSWEDSPAFSPNGKLIAYHRSGNSSEVWVMNADGTNATLLTTDALSPHWSPDGKRIAFSSGSGFVEVFTMAANGTGITNVTKTATINEIVTAWTTY